MIVCYACGHGLFTEDFGIWMSCPCGSFRVRGIGHQWRFGRGPLVLVRVPGSNRPILHESGRSLVRTMAPDEVVPELFEEILVSEILHS